MKQHSTTVTGPARATSSSALVSRLLVLGAGVYLFKFCFLLVAGSDAGWKDDVAGWCFVVGTALMLTGVAKAAWLAARSRPAGLRVGAVAGAVVGWFLLIGLADEVLVRTLDRSLAHVAEFEFSLVVTALLALAVARLVGRADRLP